MKKVRAVLATGCLLAILVKAEQTPTIPTSYEELNPSAEQVARSTELLPLYLELKLLIDKPAANPWQVLYVRQRLLEQVMSVSLQVDATTARIDSEIAQAGEFSNSLVDRRDHNENMLNLAGIATGGALGVLSSALQISAKHAKAGNSVGIGAGVIVSVISVMSLRAQSGKRKEFGFRSNMLAELFDRPLDTTDVYTPAVLAFLNAVPAVDPDKLSRKNRLIRTWTNVGRLDDVRTPKGQAKIAHLTGTIEHDYKLSINDLDDRRAMLGDLRAKLSLMKRDLASFLLKLPQGPDVPAGTP